jgi:hypothetical protein
MTHLHEELLTVNLLHPPATQEINMVAGVILA